MNDEMTGRVCMVTGATNGIGRSAAETLARRGASVVMVARDPDRGSRARDEIRRGSVVIPDSRRRTTRRGSRGGGWGRSGKNWCGGR